MLHAIRACQHSDFIADKSVFKRMGTLHETITYSAMINITFVARHTCILQQTVIIPTHIETTLTLSCQPGWSLRCTYIS